MTINDLTDKQLADMVRNSIYAKNARFGDGEKNSRFLLVLAVAYGKDEGIDHITDALEAFAALLQDDDWTEREFQVYEHMASDIPERESFSRSPWTASILAKC